MSLRRISLFALAAAFLLLQDAAFRHVLSHLGLSEERIAWATDNAHPDDQQELPGACNAPVLHAVVDGSPLAQTPAVVPPASPPVRHLAANHPRASQPAPSACSRGPPTISLA